MKEFIDLTLAFSGGVLFAAWMEIRADRYFSRTYREKADEALDIAERATELNTKILNKCEELEREASLWRIFKALAPR